MAYINLVKELQISEQSTLGQQLYDFCNANPLPLSSRVIRDCYPSEELTAAIEGNSLIDGESFFNNVLHALSFLMGDNEIYAAYHPNGQAPYMSLFSYNERLKAQHKPYIHRAVLSASAIPAVNIQRLKDFVQNLG